MSISDPTPINGPIPRGNLLRLKSRPIEGCQCSLCHPEYWGIADPEAVIPHRTESREVKVNVQLNAPTTDEVADLVRKAARQAISQALRTRGIQPPVDSQGNPWDDPKYGWDFGTPTVEEATKALSPETRRRYLQDNFLAMSGPMTSHLKGNDLKFEVRWSPASFCWTVVGPKGFYLAVHDESLAEAVKALLEGKTDVARSFADTFLLDKGMLP